MTTTQIQINGMTCNHCVASVTEELSEIAGVTDVQVELVAGGTSTATVTSDTEPSVQDLEAAVQEAGYSVVGTTQN